MKHHDLGDIRSDRLCLAQKVRISKQAVNLRLLELLDALSLPLFGF